MWQETNQGLYKKLVFADFAEAFAFMARVAELAERQGHHPRWLNEWSTVEIWLSTHEQENQITEKDRQLASDINAVVHPMQ
jgi:4a-hydroxytetrahydrobiopterin dehydratase